MIEHVKVRQKLQFMRGNLKNLQQIAVLSYEEFTTQQFVLDASLRYLQVLIEAMLDIGSHITAREGYGIPQTYAHVIELLAKNHVIDADRKKTYLDMVRFRNRIVQRYFS